MYFVSLMQSMILYYIIEVRCLNFSIDNMLDFEINDISSNSIITTTKVRDFITCDKVYQGKDSKLGQSEFGAYGMSPFKRAPCGDIVHAEIEKNQSFSFHLSFPYHRHNIMIQFPIYAAPFSTWGPLGILTASSLTQDLPPGEHANILLLGCGDPRSILFTIFCEEDNGKLDILDCS